MPNPTLLLLLFVLSIPALAQQKPAGKPRMPVTQTPTLPTRNTATDVVTYDSFPSRYVRPRRVDVWLPPGYEPAGTQRYPVIYLQDGQNVINARTSYGGVEWGLDETLKRLAAESKGGPAIMVCIWNTSLRFCEYQPQRPFEHLPQSDQDSLTREFGGGPLSDSYLKFMVEELKPEIDRRFRTLANPAHTSVMGSSMGGLISMYAVLEYPQIFGRAACLSTHWPGSLRHIFIPLPANTLAYMEAKIPPADGKHRFYFDHGTVGLDSLYGPYQKRVDSLFAAKGYHPGPNFHTQVFPGADHNERDWAKRAAIPLSFLLKE